jgi:hypothetical protein
MVVGQVVDGLTGSEREERRKREEVGFDLRRGMVKEEKKIDLTPPFQTKWMILIVRYRTVIFFSSSNRIGDHAVKEVELSLVELRDGEESELPLQIST